MRDINDTNYPWQDEYEDFKKRPRWEEVVAYGYHPQGLLVHSRKYYAYFDKETNKFDFTKDVDLLNRLPKYEEQPDRDSFERQNRVEDYWKHLPRKHQAFCEVNGIVAWEDMLLIDDKGDAAYECPHIYVDWQNGSTLVPWCWFSIQLGQQRFRVEDQFKRKAIFPRKFPRVKRLKLYQAKEIKLDADTQRLFTERYASDGTLFDIDKKYESVKARDVIPVSDATVDGKQLYIEITHKYTTTVKEYLGDDPNPQSRMYVEKQVGRAVRDDEAIHVLECQRIYEWQIKS